MLKPLVLAVCALAASGAMAQKQVLTVAAFPAVDEIVKASLAEWQKKHPNVEVRVVGREYADHHTAMTTALAASSGLPDVMTIEYGYLGRFSQSGGLEDLMAAPYSAGAFQQRFVPFAWAQAKDEKNGQTAMPTDIGPGALFYRHDTLNKAGVRPEQLTASWPSFVEAGKQIKAKTGAYLVAHARDVKDIVIRSGIPAGEGIYYNAKGESVVGTSPRFKQAFTLAKSVRDNDLDAKINAWSNDWGEGLKRGSITVQMMGAWLGGHLQNWLAPNTAGQWRSTVLPEGLATSWGGTFYAIPKKAQNKTLAWDLIQHLTLNKAQQQAAFEKFNAFPALIEAQSGAFFEQPVPFLGNQVARVQWRDTAMKIAPTEVFRNDPIAEEIVNAELDQVLTRGKSVDAALADAHRLIQRRAQR
ncbi:MAG: Lactose-binding protein precursor [Pseudomonadota bacterium]|jgi:multiple sugar transport system substrate-binding protein